MGARAANHCRPVRRPLHDGHIRPGLITDTGFLLRVEEIENKIGAGLIEEVVQMAESELKLIDVLYEAKV